MWTRSIIVFAAIGMTATLAMADEAMEYQKRLQAGRDAAYKKYLLQPTVTDADRAAATAAARPSGATLSARTVEAASASPRALMPVSSASIFNGGGTPYAFGDLRYNFYDNLNTYRQQRWSDHVGYPYIYQPMWDWRYRRSWPRPVVIRDYIKSHWLWDGKRYSYVPGHAEYRTEWVMMGWPRYRWNGSHYSVSLSFNR